MMRAMSATTILVPTDFSENASSAYDHAKLLAKKLSASILLCYVQEPFYYPVSPFNWDEVELEINNQAAAQLAAARQEFEGFDVEVVERKGSAFAELIAVAEERAVNLIVMSTQGRSGLEHLLIGSTAEKVLRKAPCPVLTVRPGTRGLSDGA